MGSRIRINHPKVVAVVGNMSREASKRAAEKLRERARQNILAAGRVDTGEMMNRILIEDVTVDPMKPQYRVRAATKQAVFNEWGTAPYQSPPGHVMRFKPKGSALFVFATRRRGIGAIHFMRRAKDMTTPRDFE